MWNANTLKKKKASCIKYTYIWEIVLWPCLEEHAPLPKWNGVEVCKWSDIQGVLLPAVCSYFFQNLSGPQFHHLEKWKKNYDCTLLILWNVKQRKEDMFPQCFELVRRQTFCDSKVRAFTEKCGPEIAPLIWCTLISIWCTTALLQQSNASRRKKRLVFKKPRLLSFSL